MRNSIAEQHSPCFVANAALEILSSNNVVEEELEQVLAFLDIETNNALGIDWVDIECLLLCDWVYDNYWMRCLDDLSTQDGILTIFELSGNAIIIRMNGIEPLEALAEFG